MDVDARTSHTTRRTLGHVVTWIVRAACVGIVVAMFAFGAPDNSSSQADDLEFDAHSDGSQDSDVELAAAQLDVLGDR